MACGREIKFCLLSHLNNLASSPSAAKVAGGASLSPFCPSPAPPYCCWSEIKSCLLPPVQGLAAVPRPCGGVQYAFSTPGTWVVAAIWHEWRVGLAGLAHKHGEAVFPGSGTSRRAHPPMHRHHLLQASVVRRNIKAFPNVFNWYCRHILL